MENKISSLIFCCGMPRSGGTLLYQITREIAEHGNLCRGRGFAKESYTNGVVKADVCQPWMVDRVKAGRAIAIGSYRDLRDIIVSLRTFYSRRARIKGPKKEWTVRDVLDYRGDLLEVYYCWRQVCDTWFRYEDADYPMTVADGVAQKLNVSLSPEQKRSIVDKYDLTANERRIANQKHWMDAGPGSMLTRVHISPTRGTSTWKDVLSREDLALIEKFGGDWLREHGYK